MTYTLSVKDGDWDFSDRRGRVVTGRPKLVQQLGIWVAEQLGVDRFHPNYGSSLQDMVGLPRSAATKMGGEKELRRVCINYMNHQAALFDEHPADFSKDEVIVSVVYVESYYLGVELHATVFVRTLAGTTESLDFTGDEGGVAL